MQARSAGGMLFRAGGEADQVVDDDVHRAADRVAGEVGVVQRLGENALAGEGGVAVHHDRKLLLASAFAADGPAWRACGRRRPDRPLPGGWDWRPGGCAPCRRCA